LLEDFNCFRLAINPWAEFQRSIETPEQYDTPGALNGGQD